MEFCLSLYDVSCFQKASLTQEDPDEDSGASHCEDHPCDVFQND